MRGTHAPLDLEETNMRTVRFTNLLIAASLAGPLMGLAADSDRQAPTAPEPGRQPPPGPIPAPGAENAKQRESTVKPPTEASMGAVERKPEPTRDPLPK